MRFRILSRSFKLFLSSVLFNVFGPEKSDWDRTLALRNSYSDGKVEGLSIAIEILCRRLLENDDEFVSRDELRRFVSDLKFTRDFRYTVREPIYLTAEEKLEMDGPPCQ